MPCATNSRIAIDDDGKGGYQVAWREGDKIGAWFNSEQGADSFGEFTMKHFDAVASTFVGTVSAASGARFVYPFNDAVIYSDAADCKSVFDISLEHQSAKRELEHLCANSYMVSDVVDLSDATDGASSLSMRHLGAVVELNMKCDNAVDYKLVDVVVGGGVLPSLVRVDLMQSIEQEYFTVVKRDDITIDVPQFASVDGIFTLPFNIFPCVVASGATIDVSARFVDENGNLHRASAELTNSSDDVEFERGTKVRLNVMLDNAKALEKSIIVTSGQMKELVGLTDDGRLSESKDNNKVAVEGVNFTFSYLGLYENFRYYGSSTITIECAEPITEIDFGCQIGFTIIEGDGTFSDGKWQGSSTRVVLKHSSKTMVGSTAPITVKYAPEHYTGGDTSMPDTGTDTTPPPAGSSTTAYSGWAELPGEESAMSGDYYYAYHMCEDTSAPMRNFSVCYSRDMMCPVWVAAPLHSCYVGNADRKDNYKDDPDIPFEQGEDWSGYDRGHLLASSDRTITQGVNDQAFYRSNIGPQIDYGFNRSGGAWRSLESFASDEQMCSDTLYVVSGCYWANEDTNSNGTVVPTHYYKAMLRTKSGDSGKAVWNCSADELRCAAFLLEHKKYESGTGTTKASMMITIDELERLTGHTFFSNVPNAPKSSFKASEWGL